MTTRRVSTPLHNHMARPCSRSHSSGTDTWHVTFFGHAHEACHCPWAEPCCRSLGTARKQVSITGHGHVAGPCPQECVHDHSYTESLCPVTDTWNVSVYRHGHTAGPRPQAWPCGMSLPYAQFPSVGMAICHIPVIRCDHITFLCPQAWPHKKSPCPQPHPCSISPSPPSNVPTGILAISLLTGLILLRGQE